VQVQVKDFSVTMELGNKGIELQIKDNNGNHLGDLIIGKAKVTWCRGRTRAAQGIQKTWQEVINFFQIND
jgi:hypothetical protein